MKNITKILGIGAFYCLVCVLITGCGNNRFPGIVPAEGVITFQGAPLDDARLLFYAQEPRAEDFAVVARTDQEGRFVMRTNGEVDGALPGEYKVVVVKSVVTGTRKCPESGDDVTLFGLATPQRYSQQATTTLRVTVPPGGDRNLAINLD